MRQLRLKLSKWLSRRHSNIHSFENEKKLDESLADHYPDAILISIVFFNETPEINLYYLKDSYQRDFFNYKTNEI